MPTEAYKLLEERTGFSFSLSFKFSSFFFFFGMFSSCHFRLGTYTWQILGYQKYLSTKCVIE